MKNAGHIIDLSGAGRHSNEIWVTHFDQDATVQFYEQFSELEKNPHVPIIVIYISSYGGEVYSLTAMRDLIKSSSKPVATIAVGMAFSCGALLLAAGTKGFRFASKDAQIMIHQVSGMAGGKASDIVESAKTYESINSLMIKNLAEDMGKKPEFLSKMIHSKHNTDWTVTAQEAQILGLVDHVTIPRLGYNPGEMYLSTVLPYQTKIQKAMRKRQRKEKSKLEQGLVDGLKDVIKKEEESKKEEAKKSKGKSKKKSISKR